MKNPLYPENSNNRNGGVYKLINLITGLIYIGSSGFLGNRWYGHKMELEAGKHRNKYLQRAWNKYGMKNFKFEVIEIIENPTKKNLEEREQYWMDYYQSYEKDKGYNLCKKAYSKKGVPPVNKGQKHTKETIEKIRRTKLSKTHTPKEVENILLGLIPLKRPTNKLSHSEIKRQYWEDVRKGIRPEPKKGRLKYTDTLQNYEWCLARSNENLSIREISELCGSCKSSVERAFKKFGLSYRHVDTTFKKGHVSKIKGKKLSDVYSPDKIKEIHDRSSASHIGKVPWNKNMTISSLVPRDSTGKFVVKLDKAIPQFVPTK